MIPKYKILEKAKLWRHTHTKSLPGGKKDKQAERRRLLGQ